QLEGGGAIAPRPLPLWRRLWGHPRDKATLSFLVLPDRVLLVRAGWFSMDFMVRREVTRLWLRDRVAACHQGHQGAAAELAARWNLAGVWGGLGRNVDRLVVVPDDAVHGLPFAQFNLGGGSLVDPFALALAYARRPPPRHARRACRKALTVATSVPIE